MFTENQINRIQELFRSEFGMEVPEDQACRHMAQFLDLIMVTYQEDVGKSRDAPP